MQGPDPRFRFPNNNMPRFPGPNMMPPGSGRGCFRPGGPPRQNFNPPPFNPRLGQSGPRFNTPCAPFRPNGPQLQRLPDQHIGPTQNQIPMSNGHPGNQRPPHFGSSRLQRPQGQFQTQRPHSPFNNGPRGQRPGNGFQNTGAHYGPPHFDRPNVPGNVQHRPPFNNGNRNLPTKNKQPKMDKRDRPENNRFYCDVCDRGYKDEDKYQAHVDSHEKCPKEGCPYVAVSKLVQLHLRLQHSAGLAKKIWVDSPEDIKKWREERKRNFPTAENINKKKEQMEQKRARGEVIEEKYFGKMRNRGRGGHLGRGRGRGNFHGQGRQIGEKDAQDLKRHNSDGSNNTDCSAGKKQKTDSEKFIDELKDSLAVFFGDADTDTDSDEDSVQEETSSKVSPLATAAGALGSLISAYEQSDDEGEVTEDIKAEKEKENSTKDSNTKLGKGGKAEQSQTNTSKKKKRNKNKKNSQKPTPIDKSLLEKLLAKEIRQERNKILQCVHYVVRHGFFDQESTSVDN